MLRINVEDDVKAYNQLFYVEQACKNFSKDFRHIFLENIFFANKQSAILANLSTDKIISFGDYKDNLGYGSYFEFGCDKFVRKEYGHFGIEAHRATTELILGSLQLY